MDLLTGCQLNASGNPIGIFGGCGGYSVSMRGYLLAVTLFKVFCSVVMQVVAAPGPGRKICVVRMVFNVT